MLRNSSSPVTANRNEAVSPPNSGSRLVSSASSEEEARWLHLADVALGQDGTGSANIAGERTRMEHQQLKEYLSDEVDRVEQISLKAA